MSVKRESVMMFHCDKFYSRVVMEKAGVLRMDVGLLLNKGKTKHISNLSLQHSDHGESWYT